MIEFTKNNALDLELQLLEAKGQETQYSTCLMLRSFLLKDAISPENLDDAFLEKLFQKDLAARREVHGPWDRSSKVKGSFTECQFKAFEQKTFLFFAHLPDPSIAINYAPGTEEHQRTTRDFWSIIGKHLPIPPAHCFAYVPLHGSYLSFSAGWSCCAVLLDQSYKQGLFVYLDGSPD